MKHWVVILMSLMSVTLTSASTFNPSQHRSYGNDCLDQYQEGSRAVFSQTRSLSCGVFGLDSIQHNIAYKKTPSSIRLLERTLVIGQGELGCCTAFAIIAALEILEPSRGFSEAELYMRVKTKARSSRTSEGCFLREYQHLLLEGVIEANKFTNYRNYLSYVKIRKNMISVISSSETLTSSTDYRASIEEFRDWCHRSSSKVPQKPEWKEQHFESKEDDGTPLAVRAFCWINPFYWGVRAISDTPSHSFDKVVTRTSTIMDTNSYFDQKFDMRQLNISRRSLATIDQLKMALSLQYPVVASVEIRKVPDTIGDLWDDLWFTGAESRINLPTLETISSGNHAICICGYDDSLGAFRLRNSWKATNEQTWGDKGFAWISYDYILEFINTAFSINKI